jgi:hypothetical protein
MSDQNRLGEFTWGREPRDRDFARRPDLRGERGGNVTDRVPALEESGGGMSAKAIGKDLLELEARAGSMSESIDLLTAGLEEADPDDAKELATALLSACDFDAFNSIRRRLKVLDASVARLAKCLRQRTNP